MGLFDFRDCGSGRLTPLDGWMAAMRGDFKTMQQSVWDNASPLERMIHPEWNPCRCPPSIGFSITIGPVIEEQIVIEKLDEIPGTDATLEDYLPVQE